jgi:hypothetical protein
MQILVAVWFMFQALCKGLSHRQGTGPRRYAVQEAAKLHCSRYFSAVQTGQYETPTEDMYAECQELLQMFGLPYIIAPMEVRGLLFAM